MDQLEAALSSVEALQSFASVLSSDADLARNLLSRCPRPSPQYFFILSLVSDLAVEDLSADILQSAQLSDDDLRNFSAAALRAAGHDQALTSRDLGKLLSLLSLASPAGLCGLHVACLLAALRTSNPHAVRFLLPLAQFPPSASLTTATDVCLYGLYGGQVAAALQDWRSAALLFGSAVVVPQTCLTSIMADAAKRWVLVSLMAHGRAPELPSIRGLKAVLTPYVEFSEAFVRGDAAALHAASQIILTRDLPMRGLVAQVLQNRADRELARLGNVYGSVPLQELPRLVPSLAGVDAAAAEKAVVEAVSRGHVKARVDRRLGMVVFGDALSAEEHVLAQQQQQQAGGVKSSAVGKFGGMADAHLLESRIQHVVELTQQVKAMNDQWSQAHPSNSSSVASPT